MSDGLNKSTFLGFARDDDGPTVAASLPSASMIKVEAPFLFGCGAVAFIAILGQYGANARFEELDLVWRQCCRWGRDADYEQEDESQPVCQCFESAYPWPEGAIHVGYK